jgi:hypothetical protein
MTIARNIPCDRIYQISYVNWSRTKLKRNIYRGQYEKKHLSRPKWKLCLFLINSNRKWTFLLNFQKKMFLFYFFLYSEICLQLPVWQYYWWIFLAMVIRAIFFLVTDTIFLLKLLEINLASCFYVKFYTWTVKDYTNKLLSYFTFFFFILS